MTKRILSLLLVMLTLFPLTALALSDHDLAIQQMQVCAFSSEYNDNGRNTLRRWEDPIKVYFSGKFTEGDVAFFHDFIRQLRDNVPDMPSVSIVNDPMEANVNMYFVKLKEMKSVIPSYVEGNWGIFSFSTWDDVIIRADIGIAYDKCDAKARKHLMMEEFIGMLGLANDHNLDKKSILYQPWTTVQKLTNADWLMLRMHYSRKVRAGMHISEAIPIMETIY